MARIEIVRDNGTVIGSAGLGDLSDAELLAKLMPAAVGIGIVPADASGQELGQGVAEYLRGKLRNAVRNWYIAQVRTQFEQESQTAGNTYLDAE